MGLNLCLPKNTRIMWLFLCLLGFFVHYISGECQYQGVLYAPGSTVPVTEPCLRCFCVKAGLQCALRVCPTLPDPPPRGCILVHRRRRCCSELVCEDDPVTTNKIEARLEPDLPELSYNETSLSHGCLHSGTLYAAGSAMLTSTRCSLCYCLRGKALCTKPRCLLPAQGCAPVYQPHACCPTRYKCSGGPQKNNDGSCLVKGTWYPAGSFVSISALGPCDRCYCVRGAVKCTKLHCAPPLPGCLPLIPPNECCPSSYNCSGVIEVQPLLNYEKPPEFSPDYAKLRNEANHVPPIKKYPQFIVAESQKTPEKISTPYYFTSTTSPSLNIIPTSRQYIATTKHLPLNDSPKYSRISLTTTKITEDKKKTTESTGKFIVSPVYKPEITTDFPNDVDGRNIRRIDDLDTTESTTELSTETTTYFTTEETTSIPSTTTEIETNTNDILNTTLIQIIGNNSECIEQIETKNSDLENEEITSTTFEPTTPEITSESILTTTVPFKKIPDIVTVKKDEDYEYDYNLQPNLEIIPFVAADAVVDDENTNTGTAYTPNKDSLRETDDPIYPYNLNLFSPPQETEGGFVPRDPPILDSFYSYQPTSVDPVNSNPIGTNSNCVLFGQEVRHGGLLPTTGPACTKCLCLFGAVVCQPPNCNDLGSQNIPIDRMDITEASNIETDPFRDVIRTEPAPDLHSLIDDLHNHQNHQIDTDKKPEDQQNDKFYDTIFELLGGPPTTPPNESSTTTPKPPKRTISTTENTNLIPSGPSSVGLLKLAGCNIYGRMYRVGKIIAELSGPCLQCKCTETGVQCNSLNCAT